MNLFWRYIYTDSDCRATNLYILEHAIFFTKIITNGIQELKKMFFQYAIEAFFTQVVRLIPAHGQVY